MLRAPANAKRLSDNDIAINQEIRNFNYGSWQIDNNLALIRANHAIADAARTHLMDHVETLRQHLAICRAFTADSTIIAETLAQHIANISATLAEAESYIVAEGEVTFSEGEAYCSYIVTTDENAVYNPETGDIDEVESEPYVLIEKVYTPVSMRGRGIARKLLSAAIAHAKAACPGMAIRLSVVPQDSDTDEARLIDFYASMGFEAEESEGDAVVMGM